MKVSRVFLINLKLHREPAYRLAQQAGIDPTVLSKLINGAEPLRPNDDRILRVGKILGLSSDEVFSNAR